MWTVLLVSPSFHLYISSRKYTLTDALYRGLVSPNYLCNNIDLGRDLEYAKNILLHAYLSNHPDEARHSMLDSHPSQDWLNELNNYHELDQLWKPAFRDFKSKNPWVESFLTLKGEKERSLKSLPENWNQKLVSSQFHQTDLPVLLPRKNMSKDFFGLF